MTTNPDEPVILATLADASGEPTPLPIDGCHRLYKAALTGRARSRPSCSPPPRPCSSAATRSSARPARRSPGARHRTRTTATEEIPDADRNHHEN
jgi:hypothetical protein